MKIDLKLTLLIKDGNIITSANEYSADILVEGEKILQIGKDLDAKGDEVVDATGKYVFPDGVDEHLHYNVFNSLGCETSHYALVGEKEKGKQATSKAFALGYDKFKEGK